MLNSVPSEETEWKIRITKMVVLSVESFISDEVDSDPDPPSPSGPGGGKAFPRPPPSCDDVIEVAFQWENVMSITEKANTDKVRVQLDLNPQQMERLRSLMSECGLETRKDLFNHALTLFGWAVGEIREGRVIGSLDKSSGEFTVVSMPTLSLLAPSSAASRLKQSSDESRHRPLLRRVAEV